MNLYTKLMMEDTTLNLINYGFTDERMKECKGGTPARIISVQKGRFGIVSEYGEGFVIPVPSGL